MRSPGRNHNRHDAEPSGAAAAQVAHVALATLGIVSEITGRQRAASTPTTSTSRS